MMTNKCFYFGDLGEVLSLSTVKTFGTLDVLEYGIRRFDPRQIRSQRGWLARMNT